MVLVSAIIIISPVVSPGDGIELFLACRVPKHQTDLLPSDPQLLLQEVHPDCLFVTLCESPATVSLDHARLSHCSISDNDNL